MVTDRNGKMGGMDQFNKKYTFLVWIAKASICTINRCDKFICGFPFRQHLAYCSSDSITMYKEA